MHVKSNLQQASFDIVTNNDVYILIVDKNEGGRSITNDASSVVHHLNDTIKGGLQKKRVYYRDSMGQFDQLVHNNGKFIEFSSCTQSQQDHFRVLAEVVQARSDISS